MIKLNIPQCEAMCPVRRYLGRFHRCTKLGRYKTSEGCLCAAHLKQARALPAHPIDLVTGKEIDRHALYYRGEIVPIVSLEEKWQSVS